MTRAMTFEEFCKYKYGSFVDPLEGSRAQIEYNAYLEQYGKEHSHVGDDPHTHTETGEDVPLGEDYTGDTGESPLPPIPPGRAGWLDTVLTEFMANIRATLSDPEKSRALMAAGLAAGSTYILFYTDTVNTLAGQSGGIMQGIGSLPPENVNIEVGI